MSEIDRLKKALNFLASHIPGASELADIAVKGSLVMESSHTENPEEDLLTQNINDSQLRNQTMLDNFKTKRLNNLEVGRLYERYIGYLYEGEKWKVTFKGIVDNFNDLGRDLICIKDNVHKVVQAKCWNKDTVVRENHIYQLFGSFTHYRMTLRQALKAVHGRSKTKEMMRNLNIKAVICTSCDLSDTAQDVINHLGIEHRQEKLIKDYPMIKCNINTSSGEKLYHLPFDPAYDTIIIGNVEGEKYVDTIKEAENLGFRRVGTT